MLTVSNESPDFSRRWSRRRVRWWGHGRRLPRRIRLQSGGSGRGLPVGLLARGVSELPSARHGHRRRRLDLPGRHRLQSGSRHDRCGCFLPHLIKSFLDADYPTTVQTNGILCRSPSLVAGTAVGGPVTSGTAGTFPYPGFPAAAGNFPVGGGAFPGVGFNGFGASPFGMGGGILTFNTLTGNYEPRSVTMNSGVDRRVVERLHANEQH